MNLIVSIWARAIETESSAKPRALADDSMVLATDSTDIQTAQGACEITGEFAHLTQQELAAKKTLAWSTSKADRAALRKIRFDEHSLQVFLDVQSLGAHLCSSKTRSVSHYESRIQDAIRIANSVSSLPLSSEDRGLICAPKIMPNKLYSSEISTPSFAQFGKLHSAIARATWKKRANRSTEVVLSLLHPVHIDWTRFALGHISALCSFATCVSVVPILFPRSALYGP
jgi:hypothetical protein